MANSLKQHIPGDWHAVCNGDGRSGVVRAAEDQSMTDQPSLFAREDTLLGVCQGLGEEIGVNPLILRVAFAVGLFFSLKATVVAYLAIGVALALFRWAFPPRRAVAAPAQAAHAPGNDDVPAELAQAA